MKLPITALVTSLALLACADDSNIYASGSHHHGAHDGLVTIFAGGDSKGFVELKLHDDKGDVELWLALDEGFTKPFLVAFETRPVLEFVDLKDRKIELAVRDSEKNAGEDGTAHMIANQTNYFIFPGETGADSAWLKGNEFSAKVILRFEARGVEYESAPMILKPHTH